MRRREKKDHAKAALSADRSSSIAVNSFVTRCVATGGLVVFAVASAGLSLALLGRPDLDAPSDGHVRLLEAKTDLNGHVVATLQNQELGLKILTLDRCIIGAQYLQEEFQDQAAFTGFALQEAVVFVNRSLRRVLQLGLGAASVPNFLRSRRIQVDVVEVSETVIDMAEKHFGFSSCRRGNTKACQQRFGRTVQGDGREFLFGRDRRYDLVISDVFVGSNPGHLHSLEVFQRIQQQWLWPSGVLMVNFVGFHSGHRSHISRKLARTLRHVFATTRCFRDEDPAEHLDAAANLVCLASDQAFHFNVPTTGDFSNPAPFSSVWVMKHFQQWQVLPAEDGNESIFQDSQNELLEMDSQAEIQAHFWSHAQTLIPSHVWTALGLLCCSESRKN